MKIALTGAQGVGKSTVLHQLHFIKHGTIIDNYEFLGSVTRELNKTKNVNINENGDEASQFLIMNKYAERAFIDNSIADRCVLDPMTYSKYMFDRNKISKELYEYQIHAVKYVMKQYDYVFYIEPEFELKDDGERSKSLEFRDEIVENFRYFIGVLDLTVLKLSGSKEERAQFILNTISNQI